MLERVVRLLILCAIGMGSAHSQSVVSTSDGLALRFDPQQGIAAVQVDGRTLPAGQIAGGFYVSELSGASKELLANGGLERDDDRDAAPDGLQAGGVWRRDSTVARTGRWSMKADIPGKEDRMSGSFGVVAPVEGGATYLASFWLKCKGRGGRHPASVGYMQQQDEKGQRTTVVFQHMMSGGVTGTKDWSRVWTLLTTEGDTRKLYFRTDIYRGYGTLWADDFSLTKIGSTPTRMATRAVPVQGGVRLVGDSPGRGLHVEAHWRQAGPALRLEGKLTSTEPRDRCIRLSYRLPLDARSGEWWSDVGTKREIKPGSLYSRTASFGTFGPYSVYPFSSVVAAGRSAALSLGVPMDPARPFRLTYAVEQGLSVEWDFGLSPLPERFPLSADFYAVVYRHDPAWGFRSAAEKYYQLFPECFTVRVKQFGNWYYHDLSKLPHPEDFGLAYNEMVTRKSVEADHKLGYINFAYTEPWGWWGWALGLKPKEGDPIPTYDEMMQVLRERAADQQLLAKKGMNRTRVAHTILNSGVYDEQGKLRLKRGYVARWGGHNWCLNASPHAVAPGKLSRFLATYEWEIEPKLALGADGIYLDSIVNPWSAAPNYRADHLARSQHPLTFSALTPRPAQLGVWHHYEFVEHLSRDLHGRGKLLMANIFPYNWVFMNHLLDVMGHEVWGADNLDRMRAERTLAYHKPYTWLMQQGDDGPPEHREKWMQMAMLYGIGPNLVGGTRDLARYERWRPLYRKYMPTIIALCQAGWEPVTYASAEPDTILLERFGPTHGRLYLTARNESSRGVTVTVTVQTASLHIAAPTRVKRLPGGRGIAFEDGRFQDTLEPGVTCAYQVLH